MCVVAIALNRSRRYPFMLAANRDERHARASAAADWWQDENHVLGGRDLVAGGTWLGISDAGRVAAVTNIYEGASEPAPRSRGKLVARFLAGSQDIDDYVAELALTGDEYGPFKLLIYADGRLHSISNREQGGELGAGVHAFGNNPPGQDWPKLERVEARLGKLDAVLYSDDYLFDLLAERNEDATSPRDSIFVIGETFGTRCSTVLSIDNQRRVRFIERRFDSNGGLAGASEFEFGLKLSTGKSI